MRNIKFIGIRGHRGSGKNTVAYLLGNIIQWLLDNYMTKQGLNINYASQLTQDSVFTTAYRVWCDCIKNDEQEALDNINAGNVYFESFGDTPRVLLQLITNIPNNYFNSDYYKDHVVVNLKDFSWKIVDDPTEETSFDESLINEIERENIDEVDEEDISMTLRDFIIYFAQVCMKYLGRSVWVKSMRRSDFDQDSYDDYYNIGTIYKIFRDIKAPSELTYVKDHDGIIIKVDRPDFKKEDAGVESLSNDSRFDYHVVINEDILTDQKLKEELVKIAIELVKV